MTAVSHTSPTPALTGDARLRALRQELLEPRPASKSFLSSRLFFWICFLSLTAVGAFLRFWRLDQQAYWTDEAHTVQRINGNFAYMLSQITDQGFPPGWYALLRWWMMLCGYYFNALQETDGRWIYHFFDNLIHQKNYLANGHAYSAGCLRIVPAFFGTLTVPAMYLLGRQFTDRRGALLVMLLAAVNPFMIYYSRDIKMYAPLCFFTAISTALLFHWQATRRHLLWAPLYVASAFCLTATHAMGNVIIGLHLLFIITRPRPRPFDAPLWIICAALAAWLPYNWYIVNHSTNNNLFWIRNYTDMSAQTLMGLPTDHIFGYLWPSYPPAPLVRSWFILDSDLDNYLATRTSASMASWEANAGWVLFAIMLVGLVPWERLWRKPAPNPERLDSMTRGRWWWVAIWVIVPAVVMACTWLPDDADWLGIPWNDVIWFGHKPAEAIWEPRYLIVIVPGWLLWLGTALRRLPTLPLRGAAILFVTTICTISSLSNHIVYRSPPYHRADLIALRYADPKNLRGSIAVAGPQTAFPNPAHELATASMRKVVTNSRDDQLFPGSNVWSVLGGRNATTLQNETSSVSWLRNSARNAAGSRIDTIVLTDRYGDLTDESALLSNKKLDAILNPPGSAGPHWKLVDEENYTWYYEWRFYVYHIWRTRVWQLDTVTRPLNPDP